MIEYASLTCSHCASFHNDTLPQLKKDYIDTGKVKLVYRDFPFDELGLRAGRRVNSRRPFVKPDLGVLLEDVRSRGERQHPFWAKVEM